jgi:hypothetical protein
MRCLAYAKVTTLRNVSRSVQSGARPHGIAGIYGNAGNVEFVSY